MDACSRFQAHFDVTDPKWPDKVKPGIINQTVGWLMNIDNRWTLIAMELDESGSPRDVTDIPTSLVLQIDILAEREGPLNVYNP